MKVQSKPEKKKISKKAQEALIQEESLYRQDESWNYSALKYFDTKGPLAYYKKYVLKEKEEDKNAAMHLGSLVDCLDLTPDLFDLKYYMFTESKVKGQQKTFVDNLFKEYLNNRNLSFSTIFNLAFEKTKYDIKGQKIAFKDKDVDKVVEMFYDNSMQDYYESLLANEGKTPVFPADIDLAEKIVKTLRTHKYTSDLMNLNSSESLEVINQKSIYFEIKGRKFKALLDKIIIDKEYKKIFLHDLKCTWESLNFAFNRLKNKYYLQEGVYYLALNKEYPDYEIIPTKYILADSANQVAPVIAETNLDMTMEALHGFTSKSGKRYKGVYQLIEELEWHYENNIWNTSKSIEDNDGVIKLNKVGIE